MSHLTRFHSYHVVVPIATTGAIWTWPETLRCLTWLGEHGVAVVLSESVPVVRTSGNLMRVECAVPAKVTVDEFMRSIASEIPDPWRVNAHGLTDRLPPVRP